MLAIKKESVILRRKHKKLADKTTAWENNFNHKNFSLNEKSRRINCKNLKKKLKIFMSNL